MWAAAVVALSLSAFFTSSETALLILNRIQLRRFHSARDAGSRRVARLWSRPDLLLPALQAGGVLFQAAAAASLTAALRATLGPEHVLRTALPLSIAAVVLGGEILPRIVAAAFPEGISRALSAPTSFAVRVLGPVAAAVNAAARRALGAGGRTSDREEFLVSVSGVHALYEEVGEESEMTPEERRLAENIFEFSQTTAEEIMTPRMDIIAAPAGAAREELSRIIVGSRHTRIPLYEGTLDNVIGFLNSKEFLLNPAKPVRELLKPVAVYPESAHIDHIFHDMQRSKVKLIVVVNEFGETVGLITNEDLVEEVVGEIYDEFEREQPPVLQVGPNEYVVDGKLSVDTLNEELGLSLSEESSVTLNGLIQELLGQIPRRGSVVDHDGVRFEVLEMDRHRVRRCRITRPAARAPEGEEAAS